MIGTNVSKMMMMMFWVLAPCRLVTRSQVLPSGAHRDSGSTWDPAKTSTYQSTRRLNPEQQLIILTAVKNSYLSTLVRFVVYKELLKTV
jgi:hypothetical protein